MEPEDFVASYFELYRVEAHNGQIASDEPNLSGCLSTIFCLADLYNPEPDRAGYELDAEQLIQKIMEEIEIYRKSQ